ncbi:MAG TPA: SDR family oxidoreductase [Bacteroidales bacterium]|nr:SDR family oxidoreductase [Bacteroidales bacterium]
MRTYLIAGASSGIARRITEILHHEGHQLYVITRHPQQLAHLQGLQFVQGNFLDDGFAPEGMPEKLDGIVYAPGTINLKPFRALKPADFIHDFEVNVLGAVRLLQASHKALKNGACASVVLFSTVAVQRGMAYHASIAAAKGAIEGLTRSLAAEWAPAIRVNAIAPSLTNTPLAARLLSSPEKEEHSAKRHPLQRVGTPDDLAAMATFLLSEHSGWITGQVFGVDGGLSTLST